MYLCLSLFNALIAYNQTCHCLINQIKSRKHLFGRPGFCANQPTCKLKPLINIGQHNKSAQTTLHIPFDIWDLKFAFNDDDFFVPEQSV